MSTPAPSSDPMAVDTAPQRIARILPLLGVAHLDRLFDYSVPEEMDQDATPGVRVRIRFAGRLVDGFIIERRRTTDHTGKLAPIKRVISSIRVLSEELWQLVDDIASRTAGTRSDVLRAAIPPRHANAEKAGLFSGGKGWEELYGTLTPIQELRKQADDDLASAMSTYHFGDRFMPALLASQEEGNETPPPAPRRSLLTVPGDDDAQLAAVLAAATAWAGHGALVIAPDAKMVNRVSHALRKWVSEAQIVEMTAQESSHVRYRRFLATVLGQARIVVGTRSAVLAPVANLALVVVLGEADDLLVDPRAPYIHAREVAKLRTDDGRTGLAVIGPHRSTEVQLWVERGDVASIKPTPEQLRTRLPWIQGLGETDRSLAIESHSPGSRLPALAFKAIREALDDDAPVLVQVPRRGYAPALACATCRTPARCRVCNGPLELPGHQEYGAPTCRWCGHIHSHFTCMACGNHSVRMTVVGHDRTAEEIGRAFPGLPITLSGGDQVKESVEAGRRIVVATPGAEPIVVTGEQRGHYGALIIMDPWIPLARADLRAEENALRQWMTAAVQVRSREDGGRVIVVGDAQISVIQQLIRWNPELSAHVELTNRKEAQLPPATVVAAIDGTSDSLAELEDAWELPAEADLLGPVELPGGVRLPPGLDRSLADQARRLIVRVPQEQGPQLGAALKAAKAIRTSQRHNAPLRVVMDPVRIG